MSRRILSLSLTGYVALIIISWSCTKLDTTTVGSDLIPAVDNITTFDTTFDVSSTQGVFDGAFMDTTKLALTDLYAIGNTIDPFGTTDAAVYFQLKPATYPYYIGVPNDTIITRDSVVLCLSYKSSYGDTSNTPIKVQAYEVGLSSTQPPGTAWDSLTTLRDINFAPVINPVAISDPTTVDLATIGTYKKISKGNDSVINQIRIKITNQRLIDSLFTKDSVYASNGGYSRDTMYRAKISNGFAVRMVQGNTILYTQLSDAATRLELHYTKKNGGDKDTAFSIFTFNTGSNGQAPRRSAVANKIVRTRVPLPAGDQEIFLQSAPGTFANVSIPGLSGLSNRIIHRAEIIMEQIPDGNPNNDKYFSEPDYLYYDLIDSGAIPQKWKPVYFDLNPSLRYDPDNKNGLPYYPSSGELDLGYMGAGPKNKTVGGVTSAYYTLNITRYLQQLVTKQTPNYVFRVYAPHNIIYPQYAATVFPYVNNIAAGRVRLYGGGNTVDPTKRMRLRIIYSKTQ